jgi:hypothetical protein
MTAPGKRRTCRLYVILARDAPVGVVFRRGPSKTVLTLHWDTAKHEFRSGQWFKGRIYETRCDLSPSGDKLIYFAAKFKDPYYTWTAISRPPFLTALAFWPKGDAWGGGGLFESDRVVCLNHLPHAMAMADGLVLPRGMFVKPLGEFSGRGEDDPVVVARKVRDGWRLKQQGKRGKHQFGAKLSWAYSAAEIWIRVMGRFAIQSKLLGVHERDGPWYVMEHDIVDLDGNVVLALGRSDWADWSKSGEALLAKDGCLYRITIDKHNGPSAPELLADLSDLAFESVEAPPEATVWNGPEPRGTLVPLQMSAIRR